MKIWFVALRKGYRPGTLGNRGLSPEELARLRPVVDAFFDKVLVMDDDRAVRANRLQLLASLQRLFLEVADLSRLPG